MADKQLQSSSQNFFKSGRGGGGGGGGWGVRHHLVYFTIDTFILLLPLYHPRERHTSGME